MTDTEKIFLNNFLESLELSESPKISTMSWLYIDDMYRRADRKKPERMIAKGLLVGVD